MHSFAGRAKLAGIEEILAEKLWVDGLEVVLEADGVPGMWYESP